MQRIARLNSREGLAPDQLTVFDALATSRGKVADRGPWGILLHRAEIAEGAERIGAYIRYRGLLPPAVRESATLATSVLMDCNVGAARHRALAAEAGVDAATLVCIESRRLDKLPGDVGVAVDIARSLVEHHRIGDALFARARGLWTSQQLVELASVIGYYSFLALVVNAFEASQD